jgi:hypothetical protein
MSAPTTAKESFELPPPGVPAAPVPTVEQQLQAALDANRRLNASMREALFQRDQAQTRAIELMANISEEREITNHVLRDLGKCMKLAGVEGVKITVNRPRRLTVVEVKDRKITGKDGKVEEKANV